MDPRRRLDEKSESLRSSRVPFIETYREAVLEEQPLGKPLEREVIVIRIEKSHFALYSLLFGFFVVLIIFGIISG
ncbi:hypothetical protein P9272_03520 [Mesorhizobium sp. WSM4976]|uniref:hypothetical protein n=1 Tax=Mesorhizobium sp. WSM4976 TaxID=3038549 RepID=UPI0024165C58|nr:hypothetical protein [Mesorhizobium sp. WSM4976]MDG4892659.1 hypothetical protein [Mesorhizobium sp. WSM4976]